MDSSDVVAANDRDVEAALIPGIFNYCDRCCHRCRFTDRCRTHVASRASEAAIRDGTLTVTEAVTRRCIRRWRCYARARPVTASICR